MGRELPSVVEGRVTAKSGQAIEGAVALFPQRGHEGEGNAWARVLEDAGGRGWTEDET